MAVWVDGLRDYGWRLGPSCHLFADTREELHSFASAIGLKPQWFQDHQRLWHYDLTTRRRTKAVSMGALEMGERDSVRRAATRKSAEGDGAPEGADHNEQ